MTMKPSNNIWIRRQQCPCGDWKCYVKYEGDDQTLVGSQLIKNETASTCSSLEAVFMPYVGQIFKSDDNAFEYYSNFARKNGFSIRKARSTESQNLGIYRRDFVCYRSGFNQPRKKANVEHPRDRKSVRCGCDAKLYLTKEIVNGVTQWYVSQFSNVHNHELLEDDQVRLLPAYRKIQEADQERILLLSKAGFPVNRIVKVLELEKGVQPGQLPFIEKDVRNFVRTCKKTVQENDALLTEKRENDTLELLEACKVMAERDAEFVYDYTTDENNKVENISWSYADSIRAYTVFGDVVTFDTTYRSITYGLLLGVWFGIDNHGKPIFLGCVLLQDESSTSFSWALQTFTRFMGGRCPQTILTDIDSSLRDAIARELPNTKHVISSWHVLSKLSSWFSQLLGLQYEEFKAEFDMLCHLEGIEEFGTHDVVIEQMDSCEDLISSYWLSSLVEWLNGMLPDLRLPLGATEEELRRCLIDGTIFCTILNKLRPGSVEMDDDSKCGSINIKMFLVAMDEMGLPSFELSNIEQGHMMPVLQCLNTLKACLDSSGEANSIQNPSRKKWNLSGEIESIQLKQGCYADLSDATILELMKSSSLDTASTWSLFSILYRIMDESIERNKGDIPHCVACLLKKIVQEIEWRVSTRAENLKNQNNLYRAWEEKYQSRIRALETLVKGTVEENKVVLNKLQLIKLEKSELEEKGRVEEQNLLELKKDNIQNDIEISRLREELESSKKMHERHCLQLEAQAESTKVVLEEKLKELECHLKESRKQVDDLRSFSESKQKRWKNKERRYRSFVDQQFGVVKELREVSKSIKREALKTKKSYSEEFNYLGIKLKGLVDAAENYHSVLAENRRLYNEVQDLKGNIRVYCRIRPFLPGQSKKHTTIEYIGENGELVVSNPSKQGKDTHRLFKFNKVFTPAATQEEVFLDMQPLIRSVLDGYNVCIFAYGQTGSGKTYTMSGPNVSSKEDWGVNYRALHDLFQISQSRKSSIIYEVGVQMIEIYNEQVRDLLVGDSSNRRLGICNTTQPNGLAVPEASMHSVKSTTDVLELMHNGLMNRAVGATALNERSSRSHSVLTIHVCGTDIKTNAVLHGSLHLVDLAGSERVVRSEATGDRLREAQHINKSLSALGDVIFALAQKNAYVPYRNSKLTQVLQSSLGGQAKTLMFVQLNPDVDSYSETISTLKFAERVSGVELGAARTNREGRDIRELMEQVAFLKETITKKDQEIERLQSLKGNGNGIKHGMSSLRYGSASPRGHSSRTPLQSQSLSRQQSLGNFEKAAFDGDKCSVNGNKHSEAGSYRSTDDSKLHNESSMQSNHAGRELGQNVNDDIELLGFGDGNSEERLSDISDGDLSMGGTETDGSICSAVEFILFPEVSKPSDKAAKVEKSDKAEKSDNIGKSIVPSKLPKLPRKVVQMPAARLSMSRSSSKVSSSARKITSATTSSFSTKPLKRWQ